jgi:hypothetical protein
MAADVGGAGQLVKVSQAGAAGLAEIRRLPLRVMLPHLPSPIQHPILPYKENGALLTIGHSPARRPTPSTPLPNTRKPRGRCAGGVRGGKGRAGTVDRSRARLRKRELGCKSLRGDKGTGSSRGRGGEPGGCAAGLASACCVFGWRAPMTAEAEARARGSKLGVLHVRMRLELTMARCAGGSRVVGQVRC